jgi:hypothetical protein
MATPLTSSGPDGWLENQHGYKMLIPDSKQSPHERNSLMKFRCGHNLWDDDAPPKFKHPGNNYSWTATMENNSRSCSCKTCRFGVSEFHKGHTKGTKNINVWSLSDSPLRQNTFLSPCKKRMYGIVREHGLSEKKTSIADKLVTSETKQGSNLYKLNIRVAILACSLSCFSCDQKKKFQNPSWSVITLNNVSWL